MRVVPLYFCSKNTQPSPFLIRERGELEREKERKGGIRSLPPISQTSIPTKEREKVER